RQSRDPLNLVFKRDCRPRLRPLDSSGNRLVFGEGSRLLEAKDFVDPASIFLFDN
ncbi:hypothetical protein BHE74_00037936, partial [Ensete ventricosum]